MERYSPRIFYVYAFFRPDTGDICSIGKGHNKRWLHKGTHNKHLKSLLKKFGDLIRVKIREHLTEREAFEIEVALIVAVGRRENGGPLVNSTDGGEGTKNMPAQSRASIARKTKARMADPIARAVIGDANRKRQADPKVKAESRARMLAQHADPIMGRLLQGRHAGYQHTEETLVILKQKALERMSDQANRDNISNSLLGLVQSDQTKAKRIATTKITSQIRKAQGNPIDYRAKDEPSRRLAIKRGMSAYFARVKDIELGGDVQ